jgi:peptidoglycan/LPS O-acetylase OafA/YrhL
VEEQFYLAWPLLLRRVGTRWLGPACVALLVVAPAVRASLAWRGAEHPAMWADTFARLDLFAGGALLALALRRRAVPVPRLSAATRGALAAGGLATYAWLGIEWAYDGWHAVGGYTAGVVASLALVVAALGVRVRVDAPLVRAGLFLGRISYGLYVVHMLALRLGARWVGVGAHPRGGALLAQGAVALALTVGLAVLSYHAIERPFLRLKDRFARVPSRAT